MKRSGRKTMALPRTVAEAAPMTTAHASATFPSAVYEWQGKAAVVLSGTLRIYNIYGFVTSACRKRHRARRLGRFSHSVMPTTDDCMRTPG